MGVISAFFTIAIRLPSASSISIESRIRATRSWIFASSWPSASSKINVLRSRSALPFTLYARCPPSVSIQKSSPIDIAAARIR